MCNEEHECQGSMLSGTFGIYIDSLVPGKRGARDGGRGSHTPNPQWTATSRRIRFLCAAQDPEVVLSRKGS